MTVTQRLIDSLTSAGPSAVHDVDLAAQQVTVDIIGLAAFDRDLEATVHRSRSAPQHSDTDTNSGNGDKQQQQREAAAAPADVVSRLKGPEGHWLLSYLGLNKSSSGMSPIDINAGSGAGISGRGGEVLYVMRHLVVAMQQRNNPLNRWFPWRKVRGRGVQLYHSTKL